MKATASYKRGIALVRREWRAGRFDRALSAVERLLGDWPDNPQLLTMRGCLQQLHETESSPEKIKATLRRAVYLGEESPEAWKELGYFLYAVEDDAGAAAQVFAKGIALCRRQLRDALLAQSKALAELGRKGEAIACLTEALALESHNVKTTVGTGGTKILDQLKELARTE